LRAQLRPNLGEEREGVPPADELWMGQALIGRFLLALSTLPKAALRLNSPLTELVREDDRVMGAVIGGPNGPRRIRTRRGVLIAAGGFEHNAEMRARFGVPGSVAGAMSPPSNDGAAIAAGMAVGADVDLMDQAWWSPGLLRPNGRATFTLGFDGGIFVDQGGRRFMNESTPYDRGGREIIARIEQGALRLPFWLVYDDRDGGLPPIQYPNQPLGDIAGYRDAGLLRSGATLAELAAAIEVPADALQATVARFNTQVESGADRDFSRGVEPYDRMFTQDRLPMDRIDRVRAIGPRHQRRAAHRSRRPGPGSVRRRHQRPIRRRQLNGGGKRHRLSRRRQPDRIKHGVRVSRCPSHGRRGRTCLNRLSGTLRTMFAARILRRAY
jgi:3-oxosteroid 1-dehydrogenase